MTIGDSKRVSGTRSRQPYAGAAVPSWASRQGKRKVQRHTRHEVSRRHILQSVVRNSP